MEYLIDTNLIVYASKPGFSELREYLMMISPSVAASAVSLVETSTYRLTKSEKRFVDSFLEKITILDVDKSIVASGKQIQEEFGLKAGDAIIAATAIEHSLIILSSNLSDFRTIKGLQLHDPFEAIECRL